jgi:hypothetical protein
MYMFAWGKTETPAFLLILLCHKDEPSQTTNLQTGVIDLMRKLGSRQRTRLLIFSLQWLRVSRSTSSRFHKAIKNTDRIYDFSMNSKQ